MLGLARAAHVSTDRQNCYSEHWGEGVHVRCEEAVTSERGLKQAPKFFNTLIQSFHTMRSLLRAKAKLLRVSVQLPQAGRKLVHGDNTVT